MKKYFLFLFLAGFILTNAADLKLGKPITMKQKSQVIKILHHPDQFNGKKVLVEGKIVDVCQEQGCWIDVASADKKEKIRVKVEDGVIVFPKDSKGKTALVQGTVEEMKAEACEEHEKETASANAEKKESKEKEDECCSAEKTAKVYQIRGLGAVIK